MGSIHNINPEYWQQAKHLFANSDDPLVQEMALQMLAFEANQDEFLRVFAEAVEQQRQFEEALQRAVDESNRVLAELNKAWTRTQN